MKIFIAVALLALSVPAFAAAKGNAFGWVEVKPIQTDGCPVTIVDAGVQDSDAQHPSAALFGSVHSDRSYTVRYEVELKVTAENVAAVEVEWLGQNAMDETVGIRPASYRWKKPVAVGKKKRESELNDRIAGDVVTYAVRVSKVKFVDGTLWTPQAP